MANEIEQRLQQYREARKTDYDRALALLKTEGVDAFFKHLEAGAFDGSNRLERELREFCLTTGKDLSAVERFVQDVDAEFSFEFL